MGRLTDKVAIVTGGAQGIGAAYARGLAAEGAKIVIADLADTGPIAGIIEQSGGEAAGVSCDVSDEAAMLAMAAQAIDRFGRIDILINNAGLWSGLGHNKVEEISVEDWDRVMAVNVRGVWLGIKVVLPHMRAQKSGKIVNIASNSAFKGVPNLAHYVSSKGAVIGMTRAVAREVGDDNICVNALAPGLTESENTLANPAYKGSFGFTVAGRAIKKSQVPEDLVGAAVFLSSSDSDFMTGQTLVVDGGGQMH